MSLIDGISRALYELSIVSVTIIAIRVVKTLGETINEEDSEMQGMYCEVQGKERAKRLLSWERSKNK